MDPISKSWLGTAELMILHDAPKSIITPTVHDLVNCETGGISAFLGSKGVFIHL